MHPLHSSGPAQGARWTPKTWLLKIRPDQSHRHRYLPSRRARRSCRPCWRTWLTPWLWPIRLATWFITISRRCRCTATAAVMRPCRKADNVAAFWEMRDPQGTIVLPDEWPIRRAARGECFSNLEYHVRRPDTGREFIGSYNGTPLRDRQGRVRLAIVTIRNVTELRRAERSFKRANTELEQRATEAAARAAQLQRLAGQAHAGRAARTKAPGADSARRASAGAGGCKSEYACASGQTCRLPRAHLLAKIHELLGQSLRTSHTLVAELSPRVLHDGSMFEIVQWLVRAGRRKTMI